MLQLLVGGGGWDEKTVSVSSGQSTDYTCTGDRGVDDGNDIGELSLEHGIEVGGGSKRGETVAAGQVCFFVSIKMRSRVGELGEDTDIGRVFELTT